MLKLYVFFLGIMGILPMMVGKNVVYSNQEIIIRHLDNQLTYCLSIESCATDLTSVQLAVRFDEEDIADTDELMSRVSEEVLLGLLKDEIYQDGKNRNVVIYDKAIVSSVHGVIYRIDIEHPCTQSVETVLDSLQNGIYRFHCMNHHELQEKVQVCWKTFQSELGSSVPVRPEDLRDFFKKRYVPENSVIFILGAYPDHVDDFLKDIYGFLKPQALFLGQPDQGLIRHACLEGGQSYITLCNLEAFHELPITGRDREKIAKIIHTMAKEKTYKLIFKRGELEKLGREVNHVHPLRFLWRIFSDHGLKNDMRKIHGTYFKWRGFLDGLCARLHIEADHDNLVRYVPGFAQALGKNEGEILHYIHTRNFEGLVTYLMH